MQKCIFGFKQRVVISKNYCCSSNINRHRPLSAPSKRWCLICQHKILAIIIYYCCEIYKNFISLSVAVNHVWVALNEIIEVQNALNQWLHFKIELNSRLFALPYRITLFLSRPKPALFILCNSQDSFEFYFKLQLIYGCNPSHMEFFLFSEINAKY